MAYGGLNKKMDAAAEIGRNLVNKHQIQPEYWRMSRVTWDGTAEPVREAKFSVVNGDRKIFILSLQLTTSRIGSLTRLIHTLLYVILYIHTFIYTYIHTYIHTFRGFRNKYH